MFLHAGARSLFSRGSVTLAMMLAIGACHPNQAGNTAATKLGDTSNPATRGSPLAEVQEACGAAGGILDGSIARRPYLQQVTTTSAMIGWVTTDPTSEKVSITQPDGKVLMAGDGTVEDAIVRDTGDMQMWAQLTGLEPDTIYCYSLERAGQPMSPRIGFRTPPTADSTRTIGVLAFGDSGGGGSDQHALRDQMMNFPYEVMIHTGDLAYDSGTISQIEDTVFGVYADLFEHIPFFPAAGNHEYKTMSGAPFRDVFALPSNGSQAGNEKWYSYDWGRIHFAAIDTEADYATQAAWLDKDLAATKLPWKIVYLHRPPYSTGTHGSDTALRKLLAPIAERHGVQLVLAGHDHNYERMVPQNGVDYIVTGGGGVGTRSVGTSSFTAFSEDVIHFLYLEVGVDKLVVHAIDAEGSEFDSTVIDR